MCGKPEYLATCWCFGKVELNYEAYQKCSRHKWFLFLFVLRAEMHESWSRTFFFGTTCLELHDPSVRVIRVWMNRGYRSFRDLRVMMNRGYRTFRDLRVMMNRRNRTFRDSRVLMNRGYRTFRDLRVRMNRRNRTFRDCRVMMTRRNRTFRDRRVFMNRWYRGFKDVSKNILNFVTMSLRGDIKYFLHLFGG